MYLLDTNVLSEFRRGPKAAPGVAAWERATPSELMFITPISVAELNFGWRSLLGRNAVQAGLLRDWVDRLLDHFAGRVVPIDLRTGLEFGRLQIGRAKPIADLWIAATALANDLTIVTRNTADFADTGVRLLDPWLHPEA
jgi:predicted nucleic acid-binding protein